jgi:hypothetical protein
MPYGDAGFHILTALEFHDFIVEGHWSEPFEVNTSVNNVYPPFTSFIGALAMFVGGRTVAAPIVAQNLLYVPLLAVACYRIAQRAYGGLAGCLAVGFALGAPLIAEQFHVFMLDAPLTALVAGTLWLVLESERFERLPIAAAAGALAGFGVLTKHTFPLYLAGFVVIVLAKGNGWRTARGFGVFLATGLLIAAPWYVAHAAEFGTALQDAGHESNVPALARPTLLSTANASWYFWALANGVLFVPLLTFAAIGVATTGWAAMRDRARRGLRLELLGGCAFAYVAITVMPHKDVRYAMPLLVFLAVLGTGWIALLARRWRIAAIVALALALAASTMGATFGIGSREPGLVPANLLPGNWYAPQGQGVMPLNRLTFYSNANYMVSGPRRAGDLLGLFHALHDAGIHNVIVGSDVPEWNPDFNPNGLILFLRIAHLSERTHAPAHLPRRQLVTLIHANASGTPPPCARLPHGSGVWLRLGGPSSPTRRFYCPRFRPPVYGP